ncbi:MAG: hypothetical protein R3C46_16665 [Hyphomonadaceae bacterium]|mgnify:CR=1 FL=1
MDEMNENEISRQIDRDVSGRASLIALTICLGVVAGILIAGAVILLRQFA